MISELAKKNLEKQHYAVVGNHSAVKICPFTKSDLKGKGGCYKSKFYGIRSSLCCQMTPSITCNNLCVFCWRDLTQLSSVQFKYEVPDNAVSIIEGAFAAQKKLLSGFGGNESVDKAKFAQSSDPMHVAISLTGEPTQYPYLKEMIEEFHARGKSTFVVTNGQYPERLEEIQPTQLYISLDAPNKEAYKQIDRPMHKDYWERFLTSLNILRQKQEQGVRTVLRITCVKDVTMIDPQGYADCIKQANPMFLEIKSYAHMGSSKYRLTAANVPTYEEVKAFAADVGRLCGYKLVDEDERSKVVLYMKEDMPERIMVWNDGKGEGDGYYSMKQGEQVQQKTVTDPPSSLCCQD